MVHGEGEVEIDVGFDILVDGSDYWKAAIRFTELVCRIGS